MTMSVRSISQWSGGASGNTVGLLRLGAGYSSCVISPSPTTEWWCTSSASVPNLDSDVTYTFPSESSLIR